MLFAVEFSAEAIGIIGAMGSTLVVCIVYLFKLLLEAKDAQITLKRKDDHEKSLIEISNELAANLEKAAIKYAQEKGKVIPVALAPIVGEHHSEETPEQKAVAELQTLRARSTAAALLLDLPPRMPGTNEIPVTDTEKIMTKLDKLPEAVVDALESKKPENKT